MKKKERKKKKKQATSAQEDQRGRLFFIFNIVKVYFAPTRKEKESSKEQRVKRLSRAQRIKSEEN